ncbi:type II toxin-antitoxin system prevent-host-death family antitoxin [Bifidobacterium myosotis]|nr:type II toxin-antitoxin system prevent-host-death family antitoxin [Bifidobacterium myosotis]
MDANRIGAWHLPSPSRLIPVSELSRGKSAKAFDAVKDGPVIVLQRSRPIAVVLSVSDYERLRRAAERNETAAADEGRGE